MFQQVFVCIAFEFLHPLVGVLDVGKRDAVAKLANERDDNGGCTLNGRQFFFQRVQLCAGRANGETFGGLLNGFADSVERVRELLDVLTVDRRHEDLREFLADLDGDAFVIPATMGDIGHERVGVSVAEGVREFCEERSANVGLCCARLEQVKEAHVATEEIKECHENE